MPYGLKKKKKVLTPVSGSMKSEEGRKWSTLNIVSRSSSYAALGCLLMTEGRRADA